jgi:transposase-like protein
MVEAAGGSAARVAKEVVIHDSDLGNWVRQGRQQANGTPTAPERAEIRELTRELERGRRERDIVARASMGRGPRVQMKSWWGRSP